MNKRLLTVIASAIFLIATSTLCLAAAATTTTVAAVNQSGTSLASFLNSLNVEQYWAKGQYVNWETGATVSGKISDWATDDETHCSGFAGSVCAMLNVPLLHAPFPNGSYNGTTYTSLFAGSYGVTFPNITATSDSLLATKQGKWLANNAQTTVPGAPYTAASPRNWCAINAYQAQSYANQGYLAVVVYESANTSTPGHIAIIAPSQPGKTLGNYPGQMTAYTSLAVDGPYEAQSGGFNSSYTTVSRGFAPPGKTSSQWFGAGSPKNTVKFYVYYMTLNASLEIAPTAVK